MKWQLWETLRWRKDLWIGVRKIVLLARDFSQVTGSFPHLENGGGDDCMGQRWITAPRGLHAQPVGQFVLKTGYHRPETTFPSAPLHLGDMTGLWLMEQGHK